jgi:hypothetical protein
VSLAVVGEVGGSADTGSMTQAHIVRLFDDLSQALGVDARADTLHGQVVDALDFLVNVRGCSWESLTVSCEDGRARIQGVVGAWRIAAAYLPSGDM